VVKLIPKKYSSQESLNLVSKTISNKEKSGTLRNMVMD
jgi:hypothetical protein